MANSRHTKLLSKLKNRYYFINWGTTNNPYLVVDNICVDKFYKLYKYFGKTVCFKNKDNANKFIFVMKDSYNNLTVVEEKTKQPPKAYRTSYPMCLDRYVEQTIMGDLNV